ncbi:MAG: AMP-binding protein [Rhizomicrobium sp.]
MKNPYEDSPYLARLAALSRDELEGLQLVKVRRQVARLYDSSAYYRQKMQSVGLRPDDIETLEAFAQRFPTSSKADFLADQQAAPPFGTRLGIPRTDVALVNLTGGTSGQGQEIYGRSQRDVHMLGYLHALAWHLAGLRRGDTVLNCVPAGGMTTGGWGPGEGLRIIGATGFHPGGNMSTDAKIDLMLRLGGLNFIYASTNYLHTLTDALLRRGIVPREAFPDMHGLFIAAEGYPVEWAQKIEEHWGCGLQEGYGSTQCAGFSASTLDRGAVTRGGARGLMRMFEWETLTEVVDPQTMRPVASGEAGEMVVTNLSIEGTPVIRFRTGDAARFVSYRDAGGGLCWNAIECGTIGRFDDMLKIRGNNVWPSAVDAAVFAFPEVVEYAGRVFTTPDGKTDVEVLIAFAAGGAERLEEIRAAIKQRTNVWMTLREVARSELPEFAYKARRWSDERQQGYKL